MRFLLYLSLLSTMLFSSELLIFYESSYSSFVNKEIIQDSEMHTFSPNNTTLLLSQIHCTNKTMDFLKQFGASNFSENQTYLVYISKSCIPADSISLRFDKCLNFFVLNNSFNLSLSPPDLFLEVEQFVESKKPINKEAIKPQINLEDQQSLDMATHTYDKDSITNTGGTKKAEAQESTRSKQTNEVNTDLQVYELFKLVITLLIILSTIALVVYTFVFRPELFSSVSISTPDKAQVYKVLSNPVRVDILRSIVEVDRILTDISSHIGKTKSTTSEHLDKLLKAGLITRIKRKGRKFVYYRITSYGRRVLIDLETKE